MESIEKMNLASKDLVADRIEQLKTLFPEIVTEPENSERAEPPGIDFEKLRLLLGDEVDEGQERYAFTWPGKANAIRQAQTPSTATLRPDEEASVDWDTTENLYIEGDNLEALKLLQRGYHGKVKLIYIDPPYNTGHDFVYKDKFGDTIENYREQTGQTNQSNPETSGRYHSDWCSMMYPRLKLARELLSEDGSIFISIDDSEATNLDKLCDEIFGPECFVGNISWQKTYSPRNDSKGLPSEIEYILVYSKSPNWIPGRLARTNEMDERYSSQDGDPRPWSSGDAAAPGAATHHGMVYAIQHPITGKLLYPANGRHWSFGSDQMFAYMSEWGSYTLSDLHDYEKRAEICGCSPDDMHDGIEAIVLKDDSEQTRKAAQSRYDRGNWPRLYFTGGGKGGIRLKRYLDEMSGKMPTNLWPYAEAGHTDEAKKQLKALFDGVAPFDTPKPVRLLDRILTISGDPNSLVLDFFSGSATTAEATIRKNAEDGGNRHFILVQLPEKASGNWDTLCDIGEERIRRAGQKIKAEIEEENRQLKLGEEPKPVPDIGFRVLKLDSSNFDRVEDGILVDNLIKPGRTNDDIIFEMMLKWGLELSLPMEKTEIAGYPITSIAADELICCMDEGLTAEVLEAIAALEPKRVFFLDSVLTDTIKLNAAQIFKRVGDKLGYEIELRTA